MDIQVFEAGDTRADFGDQQRLYPIPEKPEQFPTILYNKQVQSTSYILANIVGVFHDWFISFFPNDYFKTDRIRTQSTFTDFKSFMTGIYKKDKPILVIDPQSPEIVEDFLFGQNMLNRYNFVDPDHDNIGAKMVYSLEIMHDEEFQLVFRRNRFRFEMNVMIMEQTVPRQIDTFNMMVMNIRHNSKFMLTREIPHRIPDQHIANIAQIRGYDIHSEAFLNYLNSISQYKIIKRRTGNGKEMFFFTQVMNIQVETPSMPSKDSPETSNAIEWGARVVDQFTLIADLPAEFIFLIPEEKMTHYDDSIKEDPEKVTFISPLYADMDWPTELGDYRLTNRADVELQEGDDPDVNIIGLLVDYDPALHATIKEFVLKGQPIADILQVRVYPNGSMKEVPFDLTNDGTLTLCNPTFNKVYTICLYVNLGLAHGIEHAKHTEYIGAIEKY